MGGEVASKRAWGLDTMGWRRAPRPSAIAGRRSARWPSSRISPNLSTRNSCSRVPRLNSFGVLSMPAASLTLIPELPSVENTA